MANKTNYLEAALLNHIFRTSAFAQLTTLYVALFTATPSDAGGGTEVTIGSNAYARATISRADASWTAPAGTPRAMTNAVAINFPTPTPSGWGSVGWFAIMDAATAGNMLMWAGITGGAQTINAGNTVTFAIGALSISDD